jgi:hypothetical protein
MLDPIAFAPHGETFIGTCSCTLVSGSGGTKPCKCTIIIGSGKPCSCTIASGSGL